MASPNLPSTMRKWTYASAVGGLDQHLTLQPAAPLPKPSRTHHLIRVHAVALNPVDYKPAEAPIGRFAVPKPATPGFDISGRIVTPAAGSKLKAGDLVFGAASTNPLAGGGLADYVSAPVEGIVAVPAGMKLTEAAGVPVAAATAYASLAAYLVDKPGTRVFLNGGSGGVGTFAIQIAKALGAHVTVSCSARNADLCRSLGADEVLDYTSTRPLLEQLRGSKPFDHVVDNVFNDPELYYQAHTYTTGTAKFVEVASGPSFGFVKFALRSQLQPAVLGGGRRKCVIAVAEVKNAVLERIGEWIEKGKVRVVVEEVFGMEEVVGAFRRLKTGRARGKVVVDVIGEGK